MKDFAPLRLSTCNVSEAAKPNAKKCAIERITVSESFRQIVTYDKYAPICLKELFLVLHLNITFFVGFCAEYEVRY